MKHRNKPYLLFDAGGTLVFPDPDSLKREAARHDIYLSDELLYEGYYRLICRLDVSARSKRHRLPCVPWPRGYAHALFETLGRLDLAAQAAAAAIQIQHEKHNLWTFTFPWVEEILEGLRAQGYRMSVLSNSDGRTREVFEGVGLARYFDSIFDSADVGIAKPNGEFFRHALSELNIEPENVLYIGDIYEVDVRGANRAGIGAVHIDPLHLYDPVEWPGLHIQDVRVLPAWLQTYAQMSDDALLFPTCRGRRPALCRPHPAATGQARIDPASPRFVLAGAHPAPAVVYGLPAEYGAVFGDAQVIPACAMARTM